MKMPEPKPRGRPRLKGALTGAQRAKYLAKKAAEIAALKRDVTKIKHVAIERREAQVILLNSQLLTKANVGIPTDRDRSFRMIVTGIHPLRHRSSGLVRRFRRYYGEV